MGAKPNGVHSDWRPDHACPASWPWALPCGGQVVASLRQGLSPAQMARTLARMPDPVRLSYETIYNTFYAMPRGQLRSSLLALMRPPTSRPQTAARPARTAKASCAGDDVDRPASQRDRRPPDSRPLGGRPDHRESQPLPGRRAGGTLHPVCGSGAVAQRQSGSYRPGLLRHPQPLRAASCAAP